MAYFDNLTINNIKDEYPEVDEEKRTWKNEAEFISALFAGVPAGRRDKESTEDAPLKAGLLAALNEQEQHALFMDKEMQKRLSIRKNELYFDDIPLKTREAHPNHDGLSDLKTSIAAAYRGHHAAAGAQIMGLSSDDMKKNTANINDALKLLDSCTQPFRSSDEYREMTSALKSLAAASGKLEKEGLGWQDKANALDDFEKKLERAQKYVNSYLKKKDALGNRKNFKNSYEADRVAAARSIRTMLQAKQESFEISREVERNEEKYDRYAKYLNEKHGVNLNGLMDKKKTCCSRKRVELHRKAQKAIEKMNERRDFAKKYMEEKKMHLPHCVSDSIEGFLIDPPDSDYNKGILRSLTEMEDHKSARDNMAKVYVHGLNKAGELDKEELTLDKERTTTEVYRYTLDHIEQIKIGGYIKTISGIEKTLKMAPKNEEEMEAFRAQASGLSVIGNDMLEMLSDDNAYILPLDYCVEQKIDLSDEGILKTDNDNRLSDQEKNSLWIFSKCVDDQKKDVLKAERQQKTISVDDFNRNEVVKADQKEAASGKGRKITRLADITSEVVINGPINDDDSLSEDIQDNGVYKDKNQVFDKSLKGPESNIDLRSDAELKPEALIARAIRQLPDDKYDVNKLLGISGEIEKARVRLEKNYQVGNIYPEAAEDVKILLFAEHLKQEALYSNETKNGQTRHKVQILNNGTKNNTWQNIIKNVDDPVDNFREECRKFNFGNNFKKIEKMAANENSYKDAKNTLDLMHQITTESGVGRLYQACVQEQQKARIANAAKPDAKEAQPEIRVPQ